jgi:hypothetical protein
MRTSVTFAFGTINVSLSVVEEAGGLESPPEHNLGATAAARASKRPKRANDREHQYIALDRAALVAAAEAVEHLISKAGVSATSTTSL